MLALRTTLRIDESQVLLTTNTAESPRAADRADALLLLLLQVGSAALSMQLEHYTAEVRRGIRRCKVGVKLV